MSIMLYGSLAQVAHLHGTMIDTNTTVEDAVQDLVRFCSLAFIFRLLVVCFDEHVRSRLQLHCSYF